MQSPTRLPSDLTMHSGSMSCTSQSLIQFSPKCSLFFARLRPHWHISTDLVLSYRHLLLVLIDIRCWYPELPIDRMLACWIKYLIGCAEAALSGLELLLLRSGSSWCCAKDLYEANGHVREWEIAIDYLFGDLPCLITSWPAPRITGRGEADLSIASIMPTSAAPKRYVPDERFWVHLQGLCEVEIVPHGYS